MKNDKTKVQSFGPIFLILALLSAIYLKKQLERKIDQQNTSDHQSIV